ncbi:hypothetical protein HYS31_08240 [Candidatus Woesearchaeota archaeon]|nr:hypothetical protein [Candidatus Woesearchaeota archaeon]
MKNLYRKAKVDFTNILLVSVLIIAVALLILSIPSAIDLFNGKNELKQTETHTPAMMSRMSLTNFDKQLARQLMDTNNDGRCDICGMPVEQCIDAGELQCSMGMNSQIGVLGSQHIHADWKIYINGKASDFSDKAHMERMQSNQPVSSFIHVDSGTPAPEKTGDVLHMHATGIPLWIFFKSIGMEFNKDCIILENKKKLCNEGNKKLKFYVNGRPNNEIDNYVFNDLDKILISYGDESEEEIKNQLASVTDFAKIH